MNMYIIIKESDIMEDFKKDLPEIIALYMITVYASGYFCGIIPGVILSTISFILAIIIAYAM